MIGPAVNRAAGNASSTRAIRRPELAPKPGQTYKVVEEKTTGFSPGFTVVDENGREWSVKQGPEAHTEVAPPLSGTATA